MKVIDLLNKIANHEQLPKKIKYRDEIYTLYNEESFINYEPECGDWLFNQYLYKLNDEVEIIENIEKGGRMIEKIRQFCEYTYSDKYECWSIKEDILVDKINEIIDVVNELKESRGDE